jgi:hypothetical protein
MSNLSQFGFGGGIKSIQRGIISADATPNAVTISSVNTSKSVLHFLGNSNGLSRREYVSVPDETSFSVMSRIELTDSTTITCTAGSNYGNNGPFTTFYGSVSWQLVEYY